MILKTQRNGGIRVPRPGPVSLPPAGTELNLGVADLSGSQGTPLAKSRTPSHHRHMEQSPGPEPGALCRPPSTVRRIRITILPVGTNHVGEMQGLPSVTNACHVRHDHPGNMNLGAQEKARSDRRLSLLSWTVKKRNKNVSVDLGGHSLIWQGGKPLADCDSKKATALGEARDTDFQVSAT